MMNVDNACHAPTRTVSLYIRVCARILVDRNVQASSKLKENCSNFEFPPFSCLLLPMWCVIVIQATLVLVQKLAPARRTRQARRATQPCVSAAGRVALGASS
eukprot:878017-Pyramimonas_sp.AAC.1